VAGGRSELDRWARVLLVHDDTDALTELARLRERLALLALASARLEQLLNGAPDAELLSVLREASEDGLNLWGAVCVVQRRFKAHERGGDQ
jgi:hypothetical protein